MTNSGTAAQIQAVLSTAGLRYAFMVDPVSGNASFTSGPYTGEHIILSPYQASDGTNTVQLLAVNVDPTAGAVGDITVVTGVDAGTLIATYPSIGWGNILLGTLLVGVPLPGFGGGGAVADAGADAGATTATTTTAATVGATTATSTAVGSGVVAAVTKGAALVTTVVGTTAKLIQAVTGPTVPTGVPTQVQGSAFGGLFPLLLIGAVVLLMVEDR